MLSALIVCNDIVKTHDSLRAGKALMAQSSPQEIVVFDFDGTSISGNSPVLLVRFLWREGLLASE